MYYIASPCETSGSILNWQMDSGTLCARVVADVKCVFSRGCLILPHICSCLAVQSMHASICIGLWSSHGLVNDGSLTASLGSDEIEEEEELPTDWDAIHAL
jgi:hypothetical protein